MSVIILIFSQEERIKESKIIVNLAFENKHI